MHKTTCKAFAISAMSLILLAVLASSVAAAPVGTKGSTVVAYAQKWIGTKVVHGGTGPKTIDCSHLVYEVYRKAGAKKISFMTVAQMKKPSSSNYYKVVSKPEVGDLILWKTKAVVKGQTYWLDGHVGIYIGNGKFIHASNEARIVTTSSVSASPYNKGTPYYVRWTHT